jgi:hypothetical protein
MGAFHHRASSASSTSTLLPAFFYLHSTSCLLLLQPSINTSAVAFSLFHYRCCFLPQLVSTDVQVIELSTPFIHLQTTMLKLGYPESHPVLLAACRLLLLLAACRLPQTSAFTMLK